MEITVIRRGCVLVSSSVSGVASCIASGVSFFFVVVIESIVVFWCKPPIVRFTISATATALGTALPNAVRVTTFPRCDVDAVSGYGFGLSRGREMGKVRSNETREDANEEPRKDHTTRRTSSLCITNDT